MKNALILHGIQSTSQDNWFSWLKRELKQKGYKVYAPNLPDTNTPNLEKVYKFLEDFSFNEQTIVIGHSAGATLALGILQKLPQEIKVSKTILVAGFINRELSAEIYKYVKPSDYDHLFPPNWDWQKIKNSSKEFTIFSSTDDPFVPSYQAEFLEEKLSGILVKAKGAKHFSTGTAGESYKKFPEILKYI